MKFNTMQFAVSTKYSESSKEVHVTNVTLTEGDVPEEVVQQSAVSGNSPRVKWQGNWRKSPGGIPSQVTMTWAEWFGKPPRAQAILTAEKAFELVRNDPVQWARMLEHAAMMEKITKSQLGANNGADTDEAGEVAK